MRSPTPPNAESCSCTKSIAAAVQIAVVGTLTTNCGPSAFSNKDMTFAGSTTVSTPIAPTLKGECFLRVTRRSPLEITSTASIPSAVRSFSA